MIKEYYLKLKDKYYQLSTNEKRLLIIALVFISVLLIDRIIILPLRKYNTQLTKEREIYLKQLLRVKKHSIQSKHNFTLYKGKESELLTIIKKEINKFQLNTILLKPGTETQNEYIFKLKLEGNIESILDLIAQTEAIDFLIIWQKADIKFYKGKKYILNGEIKIYKT